MKGLFETLGEAINPYPTIKKYLTCPQCKEQKERNDEFVYSQGILVCLDCKALNLDGDKKAFDRDMKFR